MKSSKYNLTFVRIASYMLVLMILPGSIWTGPYIVKDRSGINAAPIQFDSIKPVKASLSLANDQKTFLPLILHPDPFILDAAIWPHDDTPAAHEFALFRHQFDLSQELTDSELHIFADTRYEVWIDGEWIGRGPARFTKNLHEYDIHQLGTVPVGSHAIAVLVQWAPNYRRAESTTPHLKAHISGKINDGNRMVARTGPDWMSFITNAWQKESEPVHSWELIGPSELLDLRNLDPSWTTAEFPEKGWTIVKEVDPAKFSYTRLLIPRLDNYDDALYDTFVEFAQPVENDSGPILITYQPRTIPLLANVDMSARVMETGSLSPDYLVGELVQPVPDPYSLNFSAADQRTIFIETLQGTNTEIGQITIDGQGLMWETWGDDRPDVYVAQLNVDAGTHSLRFQGIPQGGITFAVSNNIDFDYFPFEQGSHAGRRLLLANPIKHTEEDGRVFTTDDELRLNFDSPPAYAVLDLGRTIHGRLQADISGPSGSVVDIGWDERLLEGTNRPLPFPGSLHPQWNQVDSWILDGGPRSIQTIDSRAGRYILIAVWGEGTITLDNIQVFEERYPSSQTGNYSSSDPLLDKIWQQGVDTLFPNMTDAYTDTPWRERGQWWGDVYIEDQINRVAFGDTELLRRGLIQMAQVFDETFAPGAAPNNNGLHMLDYAMLWLHSLWEYQQQVQDNQMMSQMIPVIESFIEHLTSYENPDTGLLDLPQMHWSQTAYIETRSWDDRYGQSTALNALYSSTLRKAADLYEQTGDNDAASSLRTKTELLVTRINNLLYMPDEGHYAATLYDGKLLTPTPHAQAWALTYGIVPESEVDAVGNSLLELLSDDPASPNLDIYGMYWVLEALGKADLIDEAIDIIKDYYGYLIDSGAAIWWEHFNVRDSYQNSFSHGWGGSPTWFLTTYVLGATMTGSETWRLEPALDSIDYASGTLPMNEGVLRFSWEQNACDHFQINVVGDENLSGQVILPAGKSLTEIILDGEYIFQSGVPPAPMIRNALEGTYINIPGGNHELQITADCQG